MGSLSNKVPVLIKALSCRKQIIQTVLFYFYSAAGIDILDTAEAEAVCLVLSFGNYNLQIRARHILRPHASGNIIN